MGFAIYRAKPSGDGVPVFDPAFPAGSPQDMFTNQELVDLCDLVANGAQDIYLLEITDEPLKDLGFSIGDGLIVGRDLKPKDGDVVILGSEGATMVTSRYTGSFTDRRDFWGVVTATIRELKSGGWNKSLQEIRKQKKRDQFDF